MLSGISELKQRRCLNLYFTSEIRDCLDLFSTPMALKRAEAKYAMAAFNSKLKCETLAVVVHV